MGGFAVNVFATVGTTSFNPLVEALDKGSFSASSTIQIADGTYQPKSALWFRFEPNIQKHIDNADVIVCHAGAGSIFRLLGEGKVPLVVPNTERRDKHQLEIARWLVEKRYAVVAMSAAEVNQKLHDYPEEKLNCTAFAEKRFFYKEVLNELLRYQIGLASAHSKTPGALER